MLSDFEVKKSQKISFKRFLFTSDVHKRIEYFDCLSPYNKNFRRFTKVQNLSLLSIGQLIDQCPIIISKIPNPILKILKVPLQIDISATKMRLVAAKNPFHFYI